MFSENYEKHTTVVVNHAVLKWFSEARVTSTCAVLVCYFIRFGNKLLDISWTSCYVTIHNMQLPFHIQMVPDAICNHHCSSMH